jgi:metal-sulfur cluster biosynthetic enzyme
MGKDHSEDIGIEGNTRMVKVKVKVTFSLCLTKHHARNTYWGVEV